MHGQVHSVHVLAILASVIAAEWLLLLLCNLHAVATQMQDAPAVPAECCSFNGSDLPLKGVLGQSDIIM